MEFKPNNNLNKVNEDTKPVEDFKIDLKFEDLDENLPTVEEGWEKLGKEIENYKGPTN